MYLILCREYSSDVFTLLDRLFLHSHTVIVASAKIKYASIKSKRVGVFVHKYKALNISVFRCCVVCGYMGHCYVADSEREVNP